MASHALMMMQSKERWFEMGLRSGLGDRLLGEELAVDRAHVDVPAFALLGLAARKPAHRRQKRLVVAGSGAHDEFPFVGIYGYSRVLNRAIPIGKPVDVGTIQLAVRRIAVLVRREPGFGIHVQDKLGFHVFLQT